MDKATFKTMERLRATVTENLDLLKQMDKQHAPTHAMALLVYSSVGGYNRVVRALCVDVEATPEVTGYSEKSLVEQAKKLRATAKQMIATLRADEVLSPYMVDKIEYRYMKNPKFIKSVKGYMHRELGTVIRNAVRGW